MLLIVLASVPTTGHHSTRTDGRLVAPDGTPVLLHIPVIAGYEPVPAAQPCGTDATIGNVVYEEDFEGPTHDFSFLETPLAPDSENLWHVTDIAGNGSDLGHSADNRLYFGWDNITTYSILPTPEHVAGVAESGTLTLPTGSAYLGFATKWKVEWLKGYDHMWIEMLDEDDNIHLLCHANALDRGDATSQGDLHGVGSCSPYHYTPCPHLIEPSWEQRHVEIPAYLLGEDVRIRFTFDTSDNVANKFMGWMVDDVVVGSSLE